MQAGSSALRPDLWPNSTRKQSQEEVTWWLANQRGSREGTFAAHPSRVNYETNLGKSNGPITQDWLQKKRAWSKERTSRRNSCDDVWGIKAPTYRMLLHLLIQWIVRAVHQQSTNCFRKSMTTLTNKDWENTKAKVQRLQETFQLTKGRESRSRGGWRYACDFILDAVWFSNLLCRLQDDVDALTSAGEKLAPWLFDFINFQRLMQRFSQKITWVNFYFNSRFFTFTSPTPPGPRPKVSKGELLV